MTLQDIINEVSVALKTVDSAAPVSGKYQPGIGPFREPKVVKMLKDELNNTNPGYKTEQPYPKSTSRIDLTFTNTNNQQEWVIEIKQFRPLGDNGVPLPEATKHVFSPFPIDKSLLVDALALSKSHYSCQKAILLIAYNAQDFPIDVLCDSFEKSLNGMINLTPKVTVGSNNSIHPVFQSGSIIAWEVK